MGLQATIGKTLATWLATEKTAPAAPEVSAALGRRDWLLGGAMAAALLAASGCPRPAHASETPSLADVDQPEPKGYDPVLRRLVERCTYGATQDDLDLAQDLGYEGYLDYQLDYESIDDSELDSRLANFVSLNYSAKQMADAVDLGQYEVFYELANATIVRAAYSRRQLYQRMVEFWTDHFNIYIEKDYMHYLKPVDDREVIRRHALGSFPALLSASAHSPAMLVYLDNDPSSKEAPNQNYARELMELHTLGVGNYTQKDVEEVARCFTGWSIAYDYESPEWGTYRFYNWAHDKKKKRVLGVEIPKRGGARDGQIVLEILSRDPTYAAITARFIGRKLANWLWGYDPPQSLVDSIAASYLGNGGSIKKMVKTALSYEWLAQAQPKLKRPFHYVISSLRMVPSEIPEFWGLRYALSLMGHEPFQWAPPNGYPDSLSFWSGLLLPRWRYSALIYNQEYSPLFDLSQFEGDMDTDTFMKRVNKTFFGGKMPPQDRELLREYLDVNIYSNWRRRETLGLAISTPGFQWY